MLTAIVLCMLIWMQPYKQTSELEKHLWKDRLLLVLYDDQQNALASSQFDILEGSTEGLEERKLVIYLVQPVQWKLFHEPSWHKSDTLYRNMLLRNLHLKQY